MKASLVAASRDGESMDGAEEEIDRRIRTPSEAISEMEAALDFLGAHDIRPVGRFPRLVSTIRNFREGKEYDKSLLPIAFQDTYQLTEIAKHLGDCDQPEFFAQLRKAVCDSENPGDSKAETPGRNAQFELFLASQFAARGAQVKFEEPDLVVQIDSLFFGIAAKRLKSPAKLKVRLKEGVGQCVDAGGRGAITHGIVALDVSHVSNPDSHPALYNTAQTATSAAWDLIVSRVARRIEGKRMMDSILERVDVRLACGVLLFGAVTAIEKESGGIINSGRFQLLKLGPDHREVLERFMSAMRK